MSGDCDNGELGTSAVTGEPADVFVSFAHDDLRGAARLSFDGILKLLHEHHARFSPKKWQIFVDHHAIQSMQDWEHRLESGLRESGVLLALLGQRYFQRPWCQREWETWTRHERDRGVNDSLAPLYVETVPELEQSEHESVTPMLQDILRRQYVDLRPWWGKGAAALEDDDLRQRIAGLEQAITAKLDEVRRRELSPTTVPKPSEHFVGRVETLRRVREALKFARSNTIAVVSGLAGMGKSAVAFEYSHRHASDYPGGRLLVHCDGLTDVLEALISIAPELEIALTAKEQANTKQAVSKIRKALQDRQPTLIVLDNIDNLSFLTSTVSSEVLVGRPRIHLVATTRLDLSSVSDSRIVQLGLDPLGPEDGKALLARYRAFRDPTDEEDAKLIVERVEGHALSLEAVAVYLWQEAKTGVTYQGYAQRLAAEGLAAVNAVSASAANRLAVRLEDTLAGLSEEEQFALGLAALLPPTAIAFAWLEALTKAEFPHLDQMAPGYPDPWLQIRRRLLGLRLLASGADERLARMHRLVHDIVAARLLEPQRVRCQELLSQHVAVRAKLLFGAWADTQSRWELEPLRLFSLSHLDREGSEAAVEIANWIHGPLSRLGRFREARPLAERALQRATQNLSEESAFIVTATSNLAALLLAMAAPQAARRLLTDAIRREEQREAPRPRLSAMLLVNLGSVELSSEQPEAARSALERALELSKREDLELAGILSNLAVAHRKLGDQRAAREHLLRAVAIQEGLLPAYHPDLASTYQNLSNVDGALGLSTARDYLMRAVAIDERALSSDHPERAIRVMNLGLMDSRAGDLESAHQRLLQAVNVLQRTLEPHHPALAAALENLAGVEGQLGQLDAAKSHFRGSIAAQSQGLEVASLDALSPRAQSMLADTYFKLGVVEAQSADWISARDAFVAAVGIRQRSGVDDAKSNLTYSTLASVYLQLGQLEDAREAFVKCLQIEESAGADQFIPETALQLASVERALGNAAAARELAVRAIGKLEPLAVSAPPAEQGFLHSAYVFSATLDQEQGRFGEALSSGERALVLLESAVGKHESPHAVTQLMRFLMWLADLAEGAGNKARASSLRQRSDDLGRELFGSTHGPSTE